LTYTLIEYNNDPQGLGIWQRFLVPNTAFDASIRKHFEHAVRSEELDQMFDVCQCTPGCIKHATPDSVAKLAAIYLLDIKILQRRALRPFFGMLAKSLKAGSWAELYRIHAKHIIDKDITPVTVVYRLKMFI